MKATRCGGICPHGPDVITGLGKCTSVSHMAPRCDDASSAKMMFAGGGFCTNTQFSSYLPVRDGISTSRITRCIPNSTARQKHGRVFTNRSVKVTKSFTLRADLTRVSSRTVITPRRRRSRLRLSANLRRMRGLLRRTGSDQYS